MKKRFLRVIRIISIILIVGIIYGIFVSATGLAIPCVFNLVTGLKCPGCGVTHMCVALMHLDFKAAFEANQAMIFILPILTIIFAYYIIKYIRTGEWLLYKIPNIIPITLVVILFVFTVVRNIV